MMYIMKKMNLIKGIQYIPEAFIVLSGYILVYRWFAGDLIYKLFDACSHSLYVVAGYFKK